MSEQTSAKKASLEGDPAIAKGPNPLRSAFRCVQRLPRTWSERAFVNFFFRFHIDLSWRVLDRL